MVVVPEVHPEPQQPQNEKQQAANDAVVVTEVRRTIDSQTGKSPEPPKSKKSGQKQKKQSSRAPINEAGSKSGSYSEET